MTIGKKKGQLLEEKPAPLPLNPPQTERELQ
jgi:hypothetical protein